MEWPDLTPDPKLLDSVRKRPGMYFGQVGENGVLHAASHLIDEAIGRYLEGVTDSIEAHLHNAGGISVVESVPPERAHSIQVLYRAMLEGTRVIEGAPCPYPHTTFGHLCDRAMVTAVAAKLEVVASRPGLAWCARFEGGYPIGNIVTRRTNGLYSSLCVRWLPDVDVMKAAEIPLEPLASRLRALSYLAPGVTLSLRREGEELHRFHSTDGFAEHLRRLVLDRKLLHETVQVRREMDGFSVDIALVHAACDEGLVTGYANHRLTHCGGSHLDGLRDGLATALAEIERAQDYSCPSKRPARVGDGLFAVVSVRLDNPRWAGGTAGKLYNPEMRAPIAELVLETVRAAAKSEPDAWKWIARAAHLCPSPY